MRKINRQTAFGPETDALRDVVVHALQEDVQVKKKLWTVPLIAALILMLAAGALALVLGNFEWVVALESEQGAFHTWPADDRTALVRQLVQEGMIAEDEQVQRLLAGGLSDADASALATEIVTEGLGLREDIVTFMTLLEQVKGPIPFWTIEDKAWYYDTLEKNGVLGNDALDRYILPREGDIPQTQAEQTAFDAICDAYRLAPEALATYKTAVDFYVIRGDEDAAKWLVSFHALLPEGDGYSYTPRYYAVVDARTGEIVDDPVLQIQTPAQQVASMAITPEQAREMDALYAEKGHQMYWSHEERAAYLPDRFQMPEPGAISEEEATRIAWDALVANGGVIMDMLDTYKNVAMYYRPYLESTDASLWAIDWIDQEGTDGTTYATVEVLLDAFTGEVVYMYGWGDAVPSPPLMEPLKP